MIKYVIKRLFASVLTIFVVISLTFFLMRFMPGGPFDSEKTPSPAIKANLEAKFGLNKPILEQYKIYLVNLTKGELGPSMKYEGRSVQWVIGYSFPASAKLGAIAVVLSVAVGVALGILSALKQGKWQDSVCMLLATIGVTVPSFVIASLLIYVFAVKAKLLPATGFKDWRYYIMPSIALAGYSIAFITRLTRSRLLDVLRQDYIRTAKAKGLSKNAVILKHALRNSLIPVVTYLGPLIAGVLTGSFVIEKIFAVPGLGREFVTSVSNRDYTTVLGVTIFYSTFLILCNFVVDVLYVVIDPRIKLENTEA